MEGDELPACEEKEKVSPYWTDRIAHALGRFEGAMLGVQYHGGSGDLGGPESRSMMGAELRVGYDGLFIGEKGAFFLFRPELQMNYVRVSSTDELAEAHVLGARAGARFHSGILPWFAPFGHVGVGQLTGRMPGLSYDVGLAGVVPLHPFKFGMQFDYNALHSGPEERASWFEVGVFLEWTLQRN